MKPDHIRMLDFINFDQLAVQKLAVSVDFYAFGL